ncbi:hypothetical protein RPHASCH2410_CH13245 [Rhizobium phaseoli Ch24-10]|nr:hypothetical protein RPHASCH2410_CH13245 [Rhizobium phaseoli Ch24-10]
MLLIISRQQKSVCFRRAAATVFDRCCDHRDSSPCCSRAWPAAALRGCHHRFRCRACYFSLLICRQATQHRDIRVAGQERRITGRSCCPSLALEPGKIRGSAIAAYRSPMEADQSDPGPRRNGCRAAAYLQHLRGCRHAGRRCIVNCMNYL